MRLRPTFAALLFVSSVIACRREDTPPSNPTAPPGAPKKVDTEVLEKGAEVLQNLSPVRELDHYLDEERADLAARAKPQQGVDDLRAQLPGTSAPRGVTEK